MRDFITVVILGLMVSFSSYANSAQRIEVDKNTGIVSWKTKAHGVSFSLTQILPEQSRAFYVNRGFTLQQSEAFAMSCVYMTVMRNDNAAGTIHFKRSNWSVRVNNKEHKLKTVDAWVDSLKKQKVKQSALIAFRWAQFPVEQEYETGGDWNQGMLSLGLPAGSKFDLTVRWDIEGEKYETTLRGVQCAK